MQLLEAFRRYHAKPTNVRWSVTAISTTEPPELVCVLVSTWKGWTWQRDDLPKNVCEYRDDLSKWQTAATSETRANVGRAFKEGLAVRLILAIVNAKDSQAMNADPDISMAGMACDFEPRVDLNGRVTEFDGNAFAIRFERRA